MARVAFDVTVSLPCDAATAWIALTDWAGHGNWIPATTMQILDGSGGPGTRFVARSGLGPLGFDDRMAVTELDVRTHSARVEKTGPWLTGTAGFTITDRPTGCDVAWTEDVLAPGIPAFAAPVVAALARRAFRMALHRLAAQLG